jgi:hypothetical protein
MLQRQRHDKTQLDAIWEALSRMNTNINVIRSVWRRRVKKDVKIRDLPPLADVKGGGGVKSESNPPQAALAALATLAAGAPRAPETAGNKAKQSRHHSLREIVIQIRALPI